MQQGAEGTALRSRTAAWYGDFPLYLPVPPAWEVSTFLPRTPPPLADPAIQESLEHPVHQEPLRDLCRGKSRPLLIIDDPNRPTPAARVLPFICDQLQDAGIDPAAITILIAAGMHGPPGPESIQRKIGPLAATCTVVTHASTRHVARIGTTSFGTPLLVNKLALKSDVLIGIGGVYPNKSVGLGGGAKLALGILGKQTIRHLHYLHQESSRCNHATEFRQHLEEIAHRIRLDSTISLGVDANREVFQVTCGDHLQYFPDLARSQKNFFSAPLPRDADVVIANAYPFDLSFTLAYHKGTAPLRHASPGASRVLLAACSEGEGHHGLYPVLHKPLFQRDRVYLQRLAMQPFGQIIRSITNGLGRRIFGRGGTRVRSGKEKGAGAESPHLPWFFRPGKDGPALPEQLPGFRTQQSWAEIVQRVGEEQQGKDDLKVSFYPCAPLSCLADR